VIDKFIKSELLAALFQGAAIALCVQVAGIIVTYGMQILLARWMGATQYGAYDYIILDFGQNERELAKINRELSPIKKGQQK